MKLVDELVDDEIKPINMLMANPFLHQLKKAIKRQKNAAKTR